MPESVTGDYFTMRISGLSNQWGTRERLFSCFAVNADDHPEIVEKYRAIQELLLQLEKLDGPDLWIGTSHNTLNFNRRDTTHQSDSILSFLTADAVMIRHSPPAHGYRIGYSLTGVEWEYQEIESVSNAAEMIARLA